MPRRKRPDLRAARAETQRPAVTPPVDADVAMFALRTREAAEAQRQARRDARAAKHRAEEGARLQSAKDAAAMTLKAVRHKARPQPGEADTAEAAYREALAALMTFETGTRPGWALDPTPPSEQASEEADDPGAPAE